MNANRPSLLERAAEIYDFASGLPVTAPADLPPPRRAGRPVIHKAPATAVARAQTGRAEGPAPRPPVTPAVRHEKVELDPQLLAEAGLLQPDASGGSLAEEMRLIKRRLLAAVEAQAGEGNDAARLVLVASGRPGEGKTFVALNLALSIAGESERSVLLIDGDSAKPEALTRLGVTDERPGFVDALADPALDPEALVLATDIEGLCLLPAGRKERNLPELLGSARTDAVLARLLAADPRRIILIDSSPVLAVSAAAVLAEHVAHTLVVVKADTTSEPDLKETLDLLSGCDNLSLVLNNAAFQVAGKRFAQSEEYR